MVILADFSDTQLQVACKRCDQTLQEGDRFCRYCGQDQLEGDPSAVIDITQPASNGDAQAFAPMPTKKQAGPRGVRREPVLLQESAAPPAATDGRRGGGRAPSRWSMGLAAVVLLALAAVLSYDLFIGRKEETAAQSAQQPGAAREQAPAPKATAQPAPAAAERKPAEASARNSSAAAPPVTAPAAKVVPDSPAPAPAPRPAPAPPASAAAAPADESPSKAACPPALAALALCPNR